MWDGGPASATGSPMKDVSWDNLELGKSGVLLSERATPSRPLHCHGSWSIDLCEVACSGVNGNICFSVSDVLLLSRDALRCGDPGMDL